MSTRGVLDNKLLYTIGVVSSVQLEEKLKYLGFYPRKFRWAIK